MGQRAAKGNQNWSTGTWQIFGRHMADFRPDMVWQGAFYRYDPEKDLEAVVVVVGT